MEQQIRLKVMDAAEPGTIREKLYEIGWSQQRLLTGDYWFHSHDYQKVGITRKTIDDLLSSIGDRFSKQLEEMLDHFDLRIILLEGSWRYIMATDSIISNRGISTYTRSMVWNYLRRWQDKGFTLELTVNEGHTIQRLNELYALYQKPYSLSSNTKGFTDDRVLAFPSGCRGKTAMDCLDYFGSLLGTALALPEDLVKVDGVGEKKGMLIYDHFHKGEELWIDRVEEVEQPKLV